jgi:cleavage and polyadenylation specificity factor subunit 1
MLPSSLPDRHIVLTTTRSGGLGVLGTMPENLYRRLNILQNQIVVGEEQKAGLNPKAFRHVRGSEREGEVLRGVLDAGVLRGWMGLSVSRRAEMAGKAGLGDGTREELRAVLGETGVAYF